MKLSPEQLEKEGIVIDWDERIKKAGLDPDKVFGELGGKKELVAPAIIEHPKKRKAKLKSKNVIIRR